MIRPANTRKGLKFTFSIADIGLWLTSFGLFYASIIIIYPTGVISIKTYNKYV